MALGGSSKKMAEDIAAGFQTLSEAGLKKYAPPDLKIIFSSLLVEQRTLRAEQVDINEIMLIKEKNMKMGRVNQAINVLQVFARKRRIPL